MFLDAIDRDVHYMRTALDLRARRQEILAANIANADTPGYKARDLDFAAELARLTGRGGKHLSLETTHSGHLPRGGTGLTDLQVSYRQPLQPSIDGNTVNMDVERAAITENAIRYQFVVDRVGGFFKKLTTAASGQR